MKITQLLFAFLLLVLTSHAVLADDAEVGADGSVNQQAPCDCGAEVATATAKVSGEKDKLNEQINALRKEVEQVKQNAENQMLEYQGKIAQAEAMASEHSSMLESHAQSAARAKDELHAKVGGLEQELVGAKKVAADYSEARFLINADLIKKDAKDLLRKVGLFKEE